MEAEESTLLEIVTEQRLMETNWEEVVHATLRSRMGELAREL
jgi:hypothetical protein